MQAGAFGLLVKQQPRVAGGGGEGAEGVVRLVTQHHAIRQEEHAPRLAVLPAPEPAGLDRLPAICKAVKVLPVPVAMVSRMRFWATAA